MPAKCDCKLLKFNYFFTLVKYFFNIVRKSLTKSFFSVGKKLYSFTKSIKKVCADHCISKILLLLGCGSYHLPVSDSSTSVLTDLLHLLAILQNDALMAAALAPRTLL